MEYILLFSVNDGTQQNWILTHNLDNGAGQSTFSMQTKNRKLAGQALVYVSDVFSASCGLKIDIIYRGLSHENQRLFF